MRQNKRRKKRQSYDLETFDRIGGRENKKMSQTKSLRCVSKIRRNLKDEAGKKRKENRTAILMSCSFVDNEHERQRSINLFFVELSRAHDSASQKNENVSKIIPDNNQIIRYYCTNLKLRKQKSRGSKAFRVERCGKPAGERNV